MAALAFHDDREPFYDAAWTSPTELRAHPVAGLIFHVSFCGSTLLTRLIGQGYDCLAFSEPRALIDVSDAVQQRLVAGAPAPAGEAEALLGALVASSAGAPPVMVKLSSWCSDLAGHFAPDRRIVQIDMAEEAFLIAGLRGGRERLAFLVRLAAHLCNGDPRWRDVLARAVAMPNEPIARAVLLAALALRRQQALFAAARETRPDGAVLRLDAAALAADPQAATRRGADHFGLTARPAGGATGFSASEHAKQPGARFDAGERDRADAEVRALHGPAIDRALEEIERLCAD